MTPPRGAGKRALIVFGKRATPGSVKTRLTPDLTAEEAAELYQAFLEDTLERMGEVRADLRLYFAGGEAPPYPGAFQQHGEHLGERMLRAFAETFAAGYGQVVIVGTDHPTLPVAFVEKGFEALTEPRSVVIGPAEDGGYYLLGMNDLRPELFVGMEYGHSSVFSQTLGRTDQSIVAVTVLPEWYDVDTPAALRRLSAELGTEASDVPRTKSSVDRLRSKHGWLR